MNREETIEKLTFALDEALQGEFSHSERKCTASVRKYGRSVTASVYARFKAEVIIHNPKHPHRYYARLEEELARRMPTYDELADKHVETDIWADHGFSDEADYNRYRYGT